MDKLSIIIYNITSQILGILNVYNVSEVSVFRMFPYMPELRLFKTMESGTGSPERVYIAISY